MADDPRILQLLEEMMGSGHTPEQACAGCPELLPLVRERWQRVRAVEFELDALFPTPNPNGDGSSGRRYRMFGPGSELPRIPGYEVEAVLGSGGMGVVYKARHLKLKRPVAIKMLLSGAYASEQELACLMREAQAVAGLHHPHIVQVFDVGELDRLPYFTMEFIGGGTLARKLAGVPQPSAEAATLMSTLADAVQAAHAGGIVHRDLKPSNILLTSEGTPKIADFSLARSFAAETTLTLSSARVGTPSYMAPEQAMGKAEAFCPAVDIYALGAVLYEMLTGRPPFRAETPAETQRQVIAVEPAPPSRLNAMVPRDLETICLKCLQKDPQRRYSTAEAMGEDLRRFLRGEPIAARAAGLPERVAKWVRRRPAQATAITAVAVVVVGLAGSGAWIGLDRAKTSQAIVDDLREVERSQASSDWPRARIALARAKTRLDEGASAKLHRQVAQSERELDLVARFDRIHLIRSAVVDGRVDWQVNKARADREYAAVFRDAGFGGDEEDAAVVSARVAASNIREALIGVLDDWIACNSGEQNRGRQGWLLQIAREADHDPVGWRERIRDPNSWNDRDALEALARDMPETEQSLPLMLALGDRLRELGADAVGFLTRVQRGHPGDFWVNTSLGMEIGQKDSEGAIRFFQAALALRPELAVAYTNLGVALGKSHRVDESIDQFSEAIRLEPTLAAAHGGLGNALMLKGSPDEAVEEYRQAVLLDPTSPAAHHNLGNGFAQTEQLDKAADEYREALKIDPENVAALGGLGLVLHMQGRNEEAIRECELALSFDPADAAAHVNLALALKATGRADEAIAHLERAIELEPGDSVAHYDLGLDLHDTGRDSEAIDQYREALRLRPRYAEARHGLGVVIGEGGDLDGGISQFRQALEIDPSHTVSHGAIGRALMAQGHFAEGRAELQKYLESLPADEAMRAIVEGFIGKCDELIALDARLGAVLSGVDQPSDGAECLRFAELCRIHKNYAAAARLYADAFARSPTLAADVRTGCRYNAACMAALAGAGQVGASAKATALDGDASAGWRRQAREWLRADLAVWEKLLKDSHGATSEPMRKMLTHWKSDADLATIRDAAALARLPVKEREESVALWSEVDDLLARGDDAK